jgi:N-methylhydantoinase A/oxoprolinase/acetone carboxylase beta subunit
MAHGISVGIDIGGTFTDVIASGPRGISILKVPTTRSNPGDAVVTALAELLRRTGVTAEQIVRFAHGTTVATNAVIERKGARVGVIASEGFRDILEIGRQMRRQMYDLRLRPETPVWLAPGARRVEVRGRIAADGRELIPLAETSIRAAIEQLQQANVGAVAISLLFSFLDPSHERLVAKHVRAAMPEVAVSLSCEVDPAFREYERTVVTAFDAYIKPIVDRYLADMSQHLAAAGVRVPVQVMQSRGGLAGAETARLRPVRLFLSGPAAGALGGAAVGAEAGLEDLITIDVGGTSSDIALIGKGRVDVKPETHIAGYAVRVPMLDVTTLGAGGGSIAWIDSGGGLRVGPQSAGAEPGPACYGRGGQLATVTDASIVLGYLDPAFFAGGALALEPQLSHKVIAETIAGPLGIDVTTAALGIYRIANAHMADGIRLVSVNRGHDPREFTLVPLGGAGGLHAAALATELDIRRVLVPRYPGVLAAAGLLAAPIAHEVSGAFHAAIAATDLKAVRALLDELNARADALMQAEHIEGLARERRILADVGYVGQSHFIEVPFDLEAADPLAALYQAFEVAHERVNGHKTGSPAKIVNLRSVHIARLPKVVLGGTPGQSPKRSHSGNRAVHFPNQDRACETAILQRARLAADEVVCGPAVIEQEDSTTLLPPGWGARVVAGAALLMERMA